MKPEESVEAKWPILKECFGKLKRLPIVYDFVDVITPGCLGWRLPCFESQDVLEVRLRAFNP
jgi:hypothetical protein